MGKVLFTNGSGEKSIGDIRQQLQQQITTLSNDVRHFIVSWLVMVMTSTTLHTDTSKQPHTIGVASRPHSKQVLSRRNGKGQ